MRRVLRRASLAWTPERHVAFERQPVALAVSSAALRSVPVPADDPPPPLRREDQRSSRSRFAKISWCQHT